MLPYFAAEIVPHVPEPGVVRQDLDAADASANARAVIEAQALSSRLHSAWMDVPVTSLSVTGGASANEEILRVYANVHNCPVHRFQTTNSAALGAALRAWHGCGGGGKSGEPMRGWAETVEPFTRPQATIQPDPAAVDTVDFKNTVIIMTSNIGSEYLLEGVTPEGEITESAREAIEREMQSHFRPEFLNRVDDIVLFKPLSRDELTQIVALQTEDLRERLAAQGVRLELTDEARDFIARSAYDPVYGARPLKRYLQHELETRIGRALVAGEVTEGSTIEVGIADGALTTEVRTPGPVEAPASAAQ